MTGRRIAVIGSNNHDLVTYVTRMPVPGETVEAPGFEMGFGGKGANQAMAAARLGAPVTMVTCVGDDMFGTATLANFAQNGIDATHCRVVPGTPSGVAPIFVEPSGENAILIVKGANAALSPADIDAAADDLAGCGLMLLQLEVPLETVHHAVDFAARHGITCILNPAPAMPLDFARLKGLDYLVPNETELALMTAMPVETEDQIAAAARALIARGVRQVIVTLGGRGARLVTAEAVQVIPPVAVAPVDTTGAGDAFIGSFAAFLAQGAAPEAALTRAARYAADSITRRGAQKSYASAADFARFEAEHEARP
ncbi:ribokinase [Paracoccus sanguinis]|uniref:ribokinase n=1 Tax=Paracoccus sanguinis TaxID=1545044 RepID=UPI0014512E83|nr:ribokinase [Paracoccus sanguinis]QJD17366.1 ribokinase [Paracoccus sanguinis]